MVLVVLAHLVLGILAVLMMKHSMMMEGYTEAQHWNTFLTNYQELVIMILIVAFGFMSFTALLVIWLSLMLDRCNLTFNKIGKKKLPWIKQ